MIHGHDAFAAMLIEDLASEWDRPLTLADWGPTPTARRETLPNGRTICTFTCSSWMVGVETTTFPASWVGVEQRMPFTLHSSIESSGVATAWAPDGTWTVLDEATLLLQADGCSKMVVSGATLVSEGPTIILFEIGPVMMELSADGFRKEADGQGDLIVYPVGETLIVSCVART